MAQWIAPFTLASLLLLVSLLLAFTNRFEKAGRWALAGSLIGVYLLGITPVANALLSPFERPWAVVDPHALDSPVDHIVVLAAGGYFDERLPPGAQLNGTAAQRVIEGIRLHQRFPEAELLLLGGADGGMAGKVSGASPYLATAWALGVDSTRVRLVTGAHNTAAEARIIRGIIPPDRPFLLVTSASHLHRAVYLFRSQGLDPIAAPAGVWVRPHRGMGLQNFLPSATNYRKVERAFHETFGLIWARIAEPSLLADH